MNACPSCAMQYLDEVALCPRDGAVLGAPVLEGRYKLISKLGEGGMGLVYLGEHLALRKKVAVKVLRGEIAHDAQLSARFQQEAIAASQLGHEHIVSVTDFGHLPDGALFYVMEHLEGETLARALDRQKPMPLPRALTLLQQIASALGAAHDAGIVHRDLKPQNVMLVVRDGVERAKVLDFGISKVSLRDPDAKPITEQGAVLGTAEYMAPEQAAGDSVDPRTDIYALGVMAYELCTGTLPFRGQHTIATILMQINERPEPPTVRAPWLSLPPRLDALIMRCLAKAPADRPEKMSRVRAELVEIAQELGLPSSPPVATAPPPPPAVPLPKTVTSRPAKRRRLVWAVAALAAVGASAAIIAVAARLETAASPAPQPLPLPPPGEVVQTPAPVQAPPAEVTPPAQTVILRSTPPGATVFLGGQKLGKTPLSIDRPAEDGPALKFALSGYVTRELKSLPEGDTVEITLDRAQRRPPPRSDKPRDIGRVDDLKVPFP